jgi:hypothetical protein
MAQVVIQAAEFPTLEQAEHAEAELKWLYDAYVEFENTDPEPWRTDRVPPPLVEFGKRHDMAWPNTDDARFLLKDQFSMIAELLRIDRMVFFWGGGFEMGGEPMREVLRKLGATEVRPNCNLVIESPDPDARVAELAQFLDDEDYADQYTVGTGESGWRYFSLDVRGPDCVRSIECDDSGVQDWAFVTLLYQLDGEDPRFAPAAAS